MIFVLSAQHGLLALYDYIHPYNVKLSQLTFHQRLMWACNVLQDFPHADLDGDSEVMILSSQSYCRDLTPTLETLYTVHTPLKGLGIGQQLQYLTRELARSPGAQKAGK